MALINTEREWQNYEGASDVHMSTLNDDADLISASEERGLKLLIWKMGVGSLLKKENDNIHFVVEEIMSTSINTYILH